MLYINVPTKIQDISDNLVEIKPGLWSVNKLNESISYPDVNHEIQKEFQYNSFWYTHRSNSIKALIKKFPSSTIFDIGGSNGQLTLSIQEVSKAILIEPSETGINNALAKGLTPVIHASLEDIKLKESVLPGAGLFDVLEHIDDDLRFLKNIENALTPEGRLYISVPTYQFLWSEFDSSVGHFRRYNKSSLKKVLNEAGFEIEYFSYMFYLLPLPIWFFRKLLCKLKGIKKQNNYHTSKTNFLGKMLKFMLLPEILFIKNKMSIPFGSSCLCVAKKKS